MQRRVVLKIVIVNRLVFNLVWKTTTFLTEKAAEKVDFASFLPTKQPKKTENAIPAATKKATKFGLKLFNSTPKFPYIVKEIISLILPYM